MALVKCYQLFYLLAASLLEGIEFCITCTVIRYLRRAANSFQYLLAHVTDDFLQYIVVHYEHNWDPY